MIVLVGGADQREIALIGDGENDPAISILKNIASVMIKQARHDDVAAFHEADAFGRIHANHLVERLGHPGACSVHKNARSVVPAGALPRGGAFNRPGAAGAPRRHHLRARLDDRAMLEGGHRVQDDQAGVLNPAIRVFESLAEISAQRRA